MGQKFVVFGAGGMGKEVDWIADANQDKLELAYFVDDNKAINFCNDKAVYHECTSEHPLIISIAEPKLRKQLVNRHSPEVKYINLISDTVKIHSTVQIGCGCILGFDVILSCEVKVGNHIIINARTIIGHDSNIKDFVSLMYNVSISGNVSIGEGTLIGSGAVILPNIKIGKWCKIGAGAVITKDIPDYSVIVGVPGKIIKQIDINE
jgi:sugar O-acyltransferase (sialic acid O-acetyltransferase NeuD family)